MKKRIPTPVAGDAAADLAAPAAATPPAPASETPASDSDQDGDDMADRPVALFGTNLLPAIMTIGGNDVQLGTVVLSASTKAGVSAEEWNAMDEGARDALVVAEAREMGWIEQPAAPAADDTPPADADVQFVEARVLIAFDEHEPNDVLELSVDHADQLERDGHIDTHVDAVAYAKSLRA